MNKNLKYALLAGLIPLPWFLFWTTIGGLLHPQYILSAQHASELLSNGGLAALCLKIAVFGSGLGFIIFGAGIWALSERKLALGALAWILFGLAMLSNGIWPMGNPMHGLYALGLVNLIAPALAHLEISEHLKDKRMYLLTALVSVAGVLYLWMNLTGHDPQQFRGLTQRIFSSISSLWPFVTSLVLISSMQLATHRK